MCPFSSLAFLQPTTVDKEPIKSAFDIFLLITLIVLTNDRLLKLLIGLMYYFSKDLSINYR